MLTGNYFSAHNIVGKPKHMKGSEKKCSFQFFKKESIASYWSSKTNKMNEMKNLLGII